MKKLFLSLTVLVTFCLGASAQDIITKKDGTDIQAKVLEVSPTEVKYKNWDNPDGPTFIIFPADVLLIRFENGANYVVDSNEKKPLAGTPLFIRHEDPSSILVNSGLRYKQLKGLYDKDDYIKLDWPRYGLGYPWLNLVFPGLAQYCMGEPGLGTKYLLINLGCSLVGIYSYASIAASTNYYASGTAPKNTDIESALFLLAEAANIAVTVVSIVNAYNVAKVKSLYAEDLVNYSRSYSVTLAPTLLLAQVPSGLKPAPGIGLRVNF